MQHGVARRSAKPWWGGVGSIPFYLIHLLALAGVLYYGWSWSGLLLAVILYYARMFFVTAAYHRYFSHRTFKTSRPFQFVLAFLGATAAQKGALWWAARHRWHHKYSDEPEDIHSVRQRGFWYSHVGWLLGDDFSKDDLQYVPDLARCRELVWLERVWGVAPTMLGVVLYLTGGMHALLWGLLVSTVLLWHGTFTINSLSHLYGSRRYETSDDSRNNWFLALLTMGEGWHNNHHHYCSSANQGFAWWEIDVSYYLLRLLARLGLVWDLRTPPRSVLEAVAARPVRSPPEIA